MMAMPEYVVIEKGGPGSGYHDHAGRPGEVGGSARERVVRVGNIDVVLSGSSEQSIRKGSDAVGKYVKVMAGEGRIQVDYDGLADEIHDRRLIRDAMQMNGFLLGFAAQLGSRMKKAGILPGVPDRIMSRALEHGRMGTHQTKDIVSHLRVLRQIADGKKVEDIVAEGGWAEIILSEEMGEMLRRLERGSVEEQMMVREAVHVMVHELLHMHTVGDLQMWAEEVEEHGAKKAIHTVMSGSDVEEDVVESLNELHTRLVSYEEGGEFEVESSYSLDTALAFVGSEWKSHGLGIDRLTMEDALAIVRDGQWMARGKLRERAERVRTNSELAGQVRRRLVELAGGGVKEVAEGDATRRGGMNVERLEKMLKSLGVKLEARAPILGLYKGVHSAIRLRETDVEGVYGLDVDAEALGRALRGVAMVGPGGEKLSDDTDLADYGMVAFYQAVREKMAEAGLLRWDSDQGAIVANGLPGIGLCKMAIDGQMKKMVTFGREYTHRLGYPFTRGESNVEFGLGQLGTMFDIALKAANQPRVNEGVNSGAGGDIASDMGKTLFLLAMGVTSEKYESRIMRAHMIAQVVRNANGEPPKRELTPGEIMSALVQFLDAGGKRWEDYETVWRASRSQPVVRPSWLGDEKTAGVVRREPTKDEAEAALGGNRIDTRIHGVVMMKGVLKKAWKMQQRKRPPRAAWGLEFLGQAHRIGYVTGETGNEHIPQYVIDVDRIMRAVRSLRETTAKKGAEMWAEVLGEVSDTLMGTRDDSVKVEMEHVSGLKSSMAVRIGGDGKVILRLGRKARSLLEKAARSMKPGPDGLAEGDLPAEIEKALVAVTLARSPAVRRVGADAGVLSDVQKRRSALVAQMAVKAVTGQLDAARAIMEKNPWIRDQISKRKGRREMSDDERMVRGVWQMLGSSGEEWLSG